MKNRAIKLRYVLYVLLFLQYNIQAATISPTSVTIVVGATANISVTNISGTVRVRSSDTSVATVTYASGKVTVKGIKAGSATITIRDSATTRNVAVRVTAPVLSVNPGSVSVTVGATATATVSNAAGTVRATSSNTNIATVSVNSNTITIRGVSAGNTSVTITDNSASISLPVSVTSVSTPPPTSGNYTLLAWNDLGMHCLDGVDYSVFSILPPYNTLHAQLKNKAGALVTSGVELTYEAVRNQIGVNGVGTGTINTYSTKLGTDKPKTNFWDYSLKLFGLSPAPEIGLNLDGLSTLTPEQGNSSPSLSPASMTYNTEYKWFEAEGIPVTPFADEKYANSNYVKDFYPTIRVVAKDAATKAILATTTTVLPVSDEMTCISCHKSTTSTNAAEIAAKPKAGWVNDPNPEKDWKRNILKLHDERKLALPVYQQALSLLNSQNSGYKTTGLLPTADGGQPVLCAACHSSNAYFDKRNKKSVMNGLADSNGNRLAIRPFTQVLHDKHAGVIDPATAQTLNNSSNRTACYTCHPGSKTQCLRGVMGKATTANGDSLMSCQSCHGNMKAVSNANRQGWIDEPTCESCHNSSATNRRAISGVGDATNGKPIVPTDHTFATNADKPAIPGLHPNLYRFSTGHGGLQCEACHGSTHAEYPSLHADDNVQSIAVQGHAGTVAECTACHKTVPNTVNGGPHGMHTTGNAWVSAHQDAAEHGGTASCTYCHGTTSSGTPLSAIKVAKTINAGEFGTKNWPAGYQVSCYSCHNGPNPD